MPGKFLLSSQDAELLDITYSIDDPRRLPNIIKGKLPPEFDVDEVEAVYDVGPLQEIWVDCVACGRKANHRYGFVVRSRDGKRATVGQTCADTKHRLEYAEYLKAFEEKRDRAMPIRTLLTIQDHQRTLSTWLCQVPEDPFTHNLLKRRHTFARACPKLIRILEKSPDGRLMKLVRVPDQDKMVERRRKRDQKIENALKKLRVQNTGNSVEDLSKEQVAALFSHDPDFSKDTLYREEMRLDEEYGGAEFISVLPKVHRRAEHLAKRCEGIMESLAGRSSGEVSTGELRNVAHRAQRLLKDVEDFVDSIDKAAAFFDPFSIAAIVRHANKFNSVKQGGVFRVDGDMLVRQGTATRFFIGKESGGVNRKPLVLLQAALDRRPLRPELEAAPTLVRSVAVSSVSSLSL